MKNRGVLLGAAFLMATSAIGPGFLTQTTVYTQQLQSNFGFVILLSILLDIATQLNIWRVVAVSKNTAQDLANRLFPGLGYLLAFLIVMGGLAFNIGNVAGAGLGLEVLFGWDVRGGALLSASIAIGIFSSPNAGNVMDNFAKILGLLMLFLIIYVVCVAQPPLVEAVRHTFIPQQFDSLATITLVGGTVGGYISFAGVHRLLEAGVSGEENLPAVNSSATRGILLTAAVRYLLFLASLGVIYTGFQLENSNPPASVFKAAAGDLGFKFFGLVIWSAAITSVVGAAYTSVSFVRTFHPLLEKYFRQMIIGFILISTIVFILIGKPVKILVFVGTLNGFILPIALSIILLASRKERLVGQYKHPLWLQVVGWLVVALMSMMALNFFFKF